MKSAPKAAEPTADARDGVSDAVGADAEPTPIVAAAQSKAAKGMAQAGFVASVVAALNGIGRIVACQRNMKIHVVSALMVCIVGMALPLDLTSRVALLLAIAVVFFAEILNTGLEALVDLFIGAYHRLAMLAKDAAAAGVLVFAVATVLIFAEILWTNRRMVTDNIDAVWMSVFLGVPVVVLEIVGLFVVRRGRWAVPRFALSFGLLFPLMWASTDPIFAGLSGGLVVMSMWARSTFPKDAGRGAPAHLKDGDTTRLASA